MLILKFGWNCPHRSSAPLKICSCCAVLWSTLPVSYSALQSCERAIVCESVVVPCVGIIGLNCPGHHSGNIPTVGNSIDCWRLSQILLTIPIVRKLGWLFVGPQSRHSRDLQLTDDPQADRSQLSRLVD